MSATLESTVVPAASISPARREEMLSLMQQYFENVTRTGFLADLAEKQWVVMLLDRQTDALCGFSTQRLLEVNVDGVPVKSLFSGDTIVSRDHWSETALVRAWAGLALDLIDQCAPAPLYWFLISKGYRTYRFLPLFFRAFYPRYDVPTPEWAKRLIDALGRHKFADAYDAAAGVVRAGAGKDRLRPGVADIDDALLRDPHVRFFVERNPGHIRGEELCCLARLARDNITPAVRRVLGAEPRLAEQEP